MMKKWILFILVCCCTSFSEGASIGSILKKNDKIKGNLKYLKNIEDKKEYIDISDSVKQKEKGYSVNWIKKIRPSLQDLRFAKYLYLKDIGVFKDDGLLINWNYHNCKYEILDSRFLFLLIEHDSIKGMDIKDIVEKNINYHYSTNKKFTSFDTLKTIIYADSSMQGLIRVNRQNAAGWFVNDIEWYRKENSIVFCFSKITKTPPSKIRLKSYSEYFDGLYLNDKRSYKRFINSNRSILSQELYNEYIERVSEDSSITTKGVKGLKK